MARPRNNRIVHTPPLFNEFKPVGVTRKQLAQVSLSLDEYEAIRLADSLGLSHLEASEEMGVSRSTFSRLIESARKKVAEFILQGSLLKIEGGQVHFHNNIMKCYGCGHMFKIAMSEHVSQCPECGSSDLFNVASNYGHGRCCVSENKQRKFRNRGNNL